MTSTEQSPEFRLIRVRSKEDLDTIAILFTAYTTWLNIDLSFQDFAAELSSLPGKYAPPQGEILLARRCTDDEPLGCIALRQLPGWKHGDRTRTCEFKRLYVVPAARGMGVGRALVGKCVDAAKELGYEEGKLDTLPHMQSAIRTYASFGFVDCEKYYETPLQNTKFMKIDLTKL